MGADRSRSVKVALSAAVIAGALAWLFYGTVAAGAEYYKHVDEIAGDLPAWRGKRLQVHGFVPAGKLLRRKGTLEYRFHIEREGKGLDAVYTGIVPDTFKEGAEVVVKGSLDADGVLQGTEVTAKCPSKYDAQREHRGYGPAGAGGAAGAGRPSGAGGAAGAGRPSGTGGPSGAY